MSHVWYYRQMSVYIITQNYEIKIGIDSMIFIIIWKIVFNSMLCMIFQYSGKPFLIQRRLIGFESILENQFHLRLRYIFIIPMFFLLEHTAIFKLKNSRATLHLPNIQVSCYLGLVLLVYLDTRRK